MQMLQRETHLLAHLSPYLGIYRIHVDVHFSMYFAQHSPCNIQNKNMPCCAMVCSTYTCSMYGTLRPRQLFTIRRAGAVNVRHAGTVRCHVRNFQRRTEASETRHWSDIRLAPLRVPINSVFKANRGKLQPRSTASEPCGSVNELLGDVRKLKIFNNFRSPACNFNGALWQVAFESNFVELKQKFWTVFVVARTISLSGCFVSLPVPGVPF